jgi:predicted ATPase
MSRETGPIRVAVTGGPGAGKTSLLEGLELRGYAIVAEVTREIIADRKARRLSPRPSPIEFANAIVQYPYHSTAFILPPWREIYRTDSERDQSYEEAVHVYESLREWYVQCGYKRIDVPQGTVDERCAFVLRTLQMGDA